jgi:hypothetical protein
MISAKQLEANRRNAQNSTGPKTPEGKEAVRFNALRHGMRAACTILPFEDPAAFNQLCADLEADWQPRNATERLHVEQMAVHQWLLARLANFENGVFQETLPAEQFLAVLDRFSTQRARLERSFSKTMHDLVFLQQHRAAASSPELADDLQADVTARPPEPEHAPFPPPLAGVY